MKKKILSVALATTMLASMFAGCEKKDGDTLELTIWNAQGTEFVRGETPEESIPRTWLENKTGVKVGTIYGNDGGQWDQKLSRLIAGDNLPDIFYVAGGQGPTHFAELKRAKKLYPLTEELIKENAPNVWKRVPEECWDMMKAEDGTILGIPFGFGKFDETTHPDANEEERAYMQRTGTTKVTKMTQISIRDDIAKKLFPDIKTFSELSAIIDETGVALGDKNNTFPISSTEDFVKMFRDINDMNLKEDGRKVYSFGYTGGDLWVSLTYLGAMMCGYDTNNYISHWNPNTQEIDIPLRGEVIKEAAKLQNEMLREEAFDAESLIHSSSAFKEKLLNGQYAVANLDTVGGLIQVNDQLAKLGKSWRYIPLSCSIPQNEDYPLQSYTSPWTAALTLTNKLDDDDAKKVLNWINVQFSDEFEEVLWWGTPEDGLYEEVDGVRKYKDEKFNKRYIDGQSAALTIADSKGIGSATANESEFYVLAGFRPVMSRWNPRVMRLSDSATSSMNSAYYPIESDPRVELRPQDQVYDAPYAVVDECVEFWAKRDQWETPFKTALGADTEAAFEKQWQDAVNNLNKITNIDDMCKKMTEIARKQAKTLGIN